mmetsp:Transcript_95577/g.169719  ORF Transcript_95577/g.169719 Transcript_95577/m.169719 type:complete len:552 (-) Transcript_95577:72-1727(-)
MLLPGSSLVMPKWPTFVSSTWSAIVGKRDAEARLSGCRSRSRSRSLSFRQRQAKLEDFLPPPKDCLRWYSPGLGDEAECQSLSLIVPSFDHAMVWPVQEEDLSARCLFRGYQGSVYEIERRGIDGLWHSAVMKLPPINRLAVQDALDCRWPNDGPTTWGDDQLWICVPCSDDREFFHLYNRALGTQVLEVHGASADSAAASLRMAKLDDGNQQKWQVDGDSRLVSKLRISQKPGADVKLCIDVIGARDENSAEACAYSANGGSNQQWHLEAVEKAADEQGPRLVRIVSAMAGRRALAIENGSQTRKDMILEICFLTRWAHEPGLVQLQQVVWHRGIPQAIILERLGKQLGKGTGDDSKACVLQDIRNGLVAYTAASAARSLLPVAHVLQSLHRSGYVYNDLHDGNILRRLDADSYKMIDLGSVTSSDQWLTLGSEYDSRWAKNRDWRAFAVALLQLWLGGRQLDVWTLVGTNSCIKACSGHVCRWSSPVPSEAASVPEEVENMVSEAMSSLETDQALHVRELLLELFAPCCNAENICAKIYDLAESGKESG